MVSMSKLCVLSSSGYPPFLAHRSLGYNTLCWVLETQKTICKHSLRHCKQVYLEYWAGGSTWCHGKLHGLNSQLLHEQTRVSSKERALPNFWKTGESREPRDSRSITHSRPWLWNRYFLNLTHSTCLNTINHAWGSLSLFFFWRLAVHKHFSIVLDASIRCYQV